MALGDVDAVARIISMFFMVTYGSLCLISFLHHFGSSPSYRPSFKSHWILSLIGFITAVWVMFKIDAFYSFFAIIVMTVLYLYINYFHKNRKGLASIFANAIFQVNRNLQIYLQQNQMSRNDTEWRPSAICISKSSFDRDNAFKLLNWIAYKYGFGTYLHRIEGYYSRGTNEQSRLELEKLLKNIERNNYVYIDTIVSPSYTAAVSQAIQIPGIAGMDNNMLIFEYDKEKPDELNEIVDNFSLVNAGDFDVCIMGASRRPFIYKNGIHVWIKATDEDNTNLMILLSFIILGHPDWKRGNIKIFELCRQHEVDEVRQRLNNLLMLGRLPINPHNIEIIVQEEDVSAKSIINQYSADAGLTILGYHKENIKHEGRQMFEGYDKIGNMLFVNSYSNKLIE